MAEEAGREDASVEDLEASSIALRPMASSYAPRPQDGLKWERDTNVLSANNYITLIFVFCL